MGRNFKVRALESFGRIITKGNIYEFKNGKTQLDDFMSEKYDSAEEFMKMNPCLKVEVVIDKPTGGNFKVRCLDNSGNENSYTVGKVYQVKDGLLTSDDGYVFPSSVYLVKNFEDWQKFSTAKWELIPDNKSMERIQKITVKQKGRKVIAILSEDGKFVKAAKARYNPNDAAEGKPFDFEIGKKLAINRLMGEDVKNITVSIDGRKIAEAVANVMKKTLNPALKTEKSTIDWASFTSGKIAVHCDTEEKAKAFLKECDEYGIMWCSGEVASSQTNWNSYKERTKYGFFNFLDRGICYGYDFSGREIIEYTQSKTTFKEISRKAETGEYVKVVKAFNVPTENGKPDYKNGDILKIIQGGAQVRYAEGSLGGKSRVLNTSEYVVLEGYVPEETLSVKEIKRHAKPGEWIKIVNPGTVPRTNDKPDYEKGSILKALSVSNSGTVTYQEEDDGPFCHVANQYEYVVLEGYVPDEKTTIKEVKRPAKVGEWIKVVDAKPESRNNTYKNGDVLKIIKYKETTGAYWKDTLGCYLYDSEYVVLENYQPEEVTQDKWNKYIQPNTVIHCNTREKALAFLTLCENHGVMWCGGKEKATEYTGNHGAEQCYNLNEGKKISNADKPWYIEKGYTVIEYLVGSTEREHPQPFRKAKVGDKIKIVKVADFHDYKVEIGQIHIVCKIDRESVISMTNTFFDEDQEYIITEETPEVKPETIEVGDTVKVTGSGKTRPNYDGFIKTNAKSFISKFKNGYSPKNGDIGVVVGQCEHQYGGNYYAVLSNGKVFCIGEKGIEKIK